MWDDEDNNPYAFARDSAADHPESPDGWFGRPTTPPSDSSSPRAESPELIPRHQAPSDDEDDEDYAGPRRIAPKKGGYDSRIEQILYENPDLQIYITHAGKNLESGGSYIAYTIRTGDSEVRRRYSEFASLRQTLVNLHPTLIIPPIPEKHSMADYAAKPTKAKEDTGIIELRKRMLAVFLNRCRNMPEVRDDGVWWRFLDPNASWSEVLHTHPVASIPKNVLKAPPLNTSNPSPGHNYLPVPAASAKLRAGGISASTPTSPSKFPSQPSSTIEPQVFARFPPTSQGLSEEELDPYFINFEGSSRELENLLQGSMEKVNRRTLTHLSTFGDDLGELGARYNAFALSEQSQTLAAAIEKIGQSVDSMYLKTMELSSSLSAGFAEPMRESAQFAGVVRSVLRYRVLKRIQQEMTKDELVRKKALLDSLERSEMEARRIEQYLNSSGTQSSSPPRRSISSPSRVGRDRSNRDDDTASIDSDFPPTHGDDRTQPSASQGAPQTEPVSPTNHRKTTSGGNFVTNKIFGRLSHAIHGVVDVDPERTRRDQIGKTRESLVQLEQALEVSEQDVKDASAGVLKDLKRFQGEKELDLKRYMVAFAKCHIEWAKANQASWEEAKTEVDNIEIR